MKLSIITGAVATLLFSASGLAQVTVYRDRDFTGPRETLIFKSNQCMRLGNGWEDEISAVDLEKGYRCKFFWKRDCDHSDTVEIKSGRTYFGAANDKFSSYMCWKV